jgi:integrase/recombinase XerD
MGENMAQAKTLTKAELKRLFDVTRSCSRYAERDLTMLQLTHYCGMRVGEVAALRLADVVDENYRVRAEIVLDAERTKSKRARRIFLPKLMQQQLQQYVDFICTDSTTAGYLFSTQKQSHFTANTAAQHLQRLYAQAAIVGATSHSGRRTYLTELAAKGVGVRVLAEMAGHASIQTTQRYIDVNDEQMRCAAELIC